MDNVTYRLLDFNDQKQVEAYTEMLDEYMLDPMGGEKKAHNDLEKQQLIEGLNGIPTSRCFFILFKDEYVGFSTCFVNFSTFKIKPYLYVHDIFIRNNFRKYGLGKLLLKHLINYAEENKYCKVTLEVRNDNKVAMSMYHNLGFRDCEPPMYFWTKYLSC